jgi:hypothetical protein
MEEEKSKSMHKKGEMQRGKKPVNWRLFTDVSENISKEANRLGFGERGSAVFVNTFFRRYFNGETIKRDV